MGWFELAIAAVIVIGFLALIRVNQGQIFEMLIDKLRVNVVIVAVLVTWVIVDFGDKLIAQLDKATDIPPEAIIAVLALLIGTGIGGLLSAMVRMFESPSVPADLHERLMKGKHDD